MRTRLIAPAAALVAALCFVAIASGKKPGAAAGESARPNILLVMSDDQVLSTLSEMRQLQSRLVDEGVQLDSAYLVDPLCCPSRATVLTGRYTHNHGVINNRYPAGGAQRFREDGLDRDTIATRLKDAGYATAYFGKYLNDYHPADNYIPPGWDRWFTFYGDLNESDTYQVNDQGTLRTFSRAEHNDTDLVADAATAHLATVDRPWFAVVGTHAPHGPYHPPARYEHAYDGVHLPMPPNFNEADVSDKPAYVQDEPPLSASEVEQLRSKYEGQLETLQPVDEMLGRLLDGLAARGDLDNTYVVYMTDNGYLLGEHRLKAKGLPYTESVRTPMIVRGPGVPAGQRRSHLVANVDLAATFADWAGASPPAASDGTSFAPVVGPSPPPGGSWRRDLLLEHYVGRRFGGEWLALKTRRYTYVEYGTGERELYDDIGDPYQLESFSDSADPDLLARLHRRLTDQRDCAGADCFDSRVPDAAANG